MVELCSAIFVYKRRHPTHAASFCSRLTLASESASNISGVKLFSAVDGHGQNMAIQMRSNCNVWVTDEHPTSSLGTITQLTHKHPIQTPPATSLCRRTSRVLLASSLLLSSLASPISLCRFWFTDCTHSSPPYSFLASRTHIFCARTLA